MFKKMIYGLLIVSSLSISSFVSAKEPFVKNQGDIPSEFDSSLLAGQWVVDEGKPVTKNFSKKPKFVIISQGDMVGLDAKIQRFIDQGLRTERLHTLKSKDQVMEVLGQTNDLEYINRNYTEENFHKESLHEIYRQAYKEYNNFVKDNDENTVVLSFYNKNSLIYGTDSIGLFTYRTMDFLPPKERNQWDEQVQKLKDDFSFDVKSGVDFFFLNNKKELMAIDIISDNKFIIYNLKYARSMTLIKDVEDNYPVSYDAYFKELEK